jgi:Protein of unknown function (DUF760)/EF-hand domain pair
MVATPLALAAYHLNLSKMLRLCVLLAPLLSLSWCDPTDAFAPIPTFMSRAHLTAALDASYSITRRHVGGGASIILLRDDNSDEDDDGSNRDDDDDDDDDDESEEADAYSQAAPSEFLEAERGSLLVGPVTTVDWGGEYGKLRERFSEAESGGATPSSALFRIMTSETPNQAIGKFFQEANPQVVQAMSGAVNGLLGGLSNPVMGETLVKASGDKIANLCFQLQMTGYMFRNVEYVLALKDLMNLQNSASLQEYKDAFDKLDSDGSGYIESAEIEDLLQDVYQDVVPQYEVENFLNFFDANNDGRISWDEFEKGLGALNVQDSSKRLGGFSPRSMEEDEDDHDVDTIDMQTTISGTVDIEMKNGKVIQLTAKDYIESLRKEAEALKEALRRESGNMAMDLLVNDNISNPGSAVVSPSSRPSESKLGEGLAGYIASRDGDVKSLTEGISTEIVETMKKLIDFVLQGNNKANKITDRSKLEMEIPGSALQQLALWQLVLGYKLREAEATGEYLKLLE